MKLLDRSVGEHSSSIAPFSAVALGSRVARKRTQKLKGFERKRLGGCRWPVAERLTAGDDRPPRVMLGRMMQNCVTAQVPLLPIPYFEPSR